MAWHGPVESIQQELRGTHWRAEETPYVCFVSRSTLTRNSQGTCWLQLHLQVGASSSRISIKHVCLTDRTSAKKNYLAWTHTPFSLDWSGLFLCGMSKHVWKSITRRLFCCWRLLMILMIERSSICFAQNNANKKMLTNTNYTLWCEPF